MSENDKPEVNEGNLLSRRELLGASAALGTGAMLAGGGSRSAKAQTSSEPRLKLGEDYAIDDSPNGNGDLVVEHLPSGATFSYDTANSEWSLGSFSADSVRTDELLVTNETLVKAYLSGNQSISDASKVKLQLAEEGADVRNEWDTTNYEFVPDESGWYLVTLSARFAVGADQDRLLVQFYDGTNSASKLEALTYSSGSSGPEIISTLGLVELVSGDTYYCTVQNSDSSDTIEDYNQSTFVSIRRQFL